MAGFSRVARFAVQRCSNKCPPICSTNTFWGEARRLTIQAPMTLTSRVFPHLLLNRAAVLSSRRMTECLTF